MGSIEDTTQHQLRAIAEGGNVDGKVTADLKKRKLVTPESWTTFRLSKGPKFALEKKKAPTDLTADMLQKCAPVMLDLVVPEGIFHSVGWSPSSGVQRHMARRRLQGVQLLRHGVADCRRSSAPSP